MATDEIQQLVHDLRAAITSDLAPDRERSLALTKLDELELWLTRTELA